MLENLHIKKSFLESGKDLMVSSKLMVKHPTIQEVLDIDVEHNGYYSEDFYYSWVSIFICDPYNYMVYLDDKNLDYEKVEKFELFVIMYKDLIDKYIEKSKELPNEDIDEAFLNNQYFKAFKFFLDIDYFEIAKYEDGEHVLTNKDRDCVLLDKNTFNIVSEFICCINGIKEGDRINPDDGFAKQILIEDERARLKKLAKAPRDDVENNRLGNLLSSVTWGGSGGITPFNRNNLHMYDLIDGIQRTDKVLNYNHTITGLYSGCVDKDKLDMQKISWQS